MWGGCEVETVIVRESTPADFPALASIISASQAWTCFGIDYKMALNIFERMEDAIYVTEKDKQVVGFITFRVNGVGNIGGYVRMVAVAEQFKTQGIGTQLINHVSKIASKNIPNLFLICSLDNLAAQCFYNKMGFEKVGILKDLVIKGHDELLYRKSMGTIY